jgi:hypothetical protein
MRHYLAGSLILIAIALVAHSVDVAVAAEQSISQAAPRELKPIVSFIGADSAIADRRLVRIGDADAWRALWTEHRGERASRNAFDDPVAPEIDFDHNIVIANFRGDGWNCHGDFIVSLKERADDVLLRFDSRTFQTAGPDGGGIRVRPYGIWIIPRFDKPIVVEENVQGLIGRPPKWKEQARFETD